MDRYYFLGIGGSAMAAVATALRASGAAVDGADHGVYPPARDVLTAAGIHAHERYDAAHIDEALDRARRDGAPPPLFVVGNAISRGNPELEEILDRRLPMTSMAALAGERLIGARRSLVVAGTHGKTTTASLAAWTLESAGRQPGFLIGGVPRNFPSGCRHAAGTVFVTEGDEYDTAFFDKRAKFVHYRPDIAVINNVEFDHADIFLSLDDVIRTFRQLAALVPRSGLLLVNGDDPRAIEAARGAHTTVERFGRDADCEWRLTAVDADGGGCVFTTAHRDAAWCRTWRLPLPGEHNARNALAVLAACARLGLAPAEVQRGFDGFLGVRRRMDVRADTGGIVLVDDFAHHPTAIRETLRAASARWPGRRLVALFEPRSNTTTRAVFQHELADALSHAGVVIVGALNRPERYAEDERLDIDRLTGDLRSRGVDAQWEPDPARMVDALLPLLREGDVVLTLSNGSFGGANALLEEALRARTGG